MCMNQVPYFICLSVSFFSGSGSCFAFNVSLGFNTVKSKSVPPSSFITIESRR